MNLFQLESNHFLREFSLGNDIHSVMISGKICDRQHRFIYEEIFKFWHQNWKKAFSEISMGFSESSEEFCRHENIVALLHGETVIGCVLMDRFDLENPVHLRHHYFTNYPPEVLQKLSVLTQGRPAMTVGYLTLQAEYRKLPGLTDTLLGLAVKYFLLSGSEILITYTRNTRKTNDLTFRLGARPLLQGVSVRGEPSDFVYFDKNISPAQFQQNPYISFIEKLWNQQLYNLQKNVQPINQEGSVYEQIRFESSL